MADDTASPAYVNVKDSSGNIVSVPAEHAQNLTAGYTNLSPEETAQAAQQTEFGTTGQQIATGLEGAASAASFGTSTGLEQFLGVPKENIEARRKVNPGSYLAGQVGGLAASTLLGGAGAANILGRAGEAAAGAVGLGEAANVASRIGSAAVKSAVETAMFQSGDEISKMLLSDPNQTAETAVANIGLSGLLGAGIGGALGSVSPLWESAFGSKTAAVLEDVKNTAGGVEARPLEVPADQAQMVSNQASMLKPNSQDIQDAAERLGVDPTVGTLSNSKFIQKLENVLSTRGSIPGQLIQGETSNIFDKISTAAESTLNDASNKTEAQISDELQNGAVKSFKDELAPITKQYEELAPQLKKMQVNPAQARGVGNALKNLDIVKEAPGGDAAILANRLGDEISNLKTVSAIKNYRTGINLELQKALRAGGPEVEVLMKAKQFLTTMRETAIDNASKATGLGEKEAGEISSDTIQQLKKADADYTKYKARLRSFGQAAKIGDSVSGTSQLFTKLSKLNDSSLASKIFNTDNLGTLKFMQEQMPEQYELARQGKLRQILDASQSTKQGDNGKFLVGNYLSKLQDKNIGPEAKALLLGDGIGKYSDVKTLYQAIPGIVNPSGTDVSRGLSQLFSLEGLANNASDAAKYAVLKGAGLAARASQTANGKAAGLGLMQVLRSSADTSASGYKSAVDYITHTIKGENLLGRAIDNTFKSGGVVIPTKMLPDEKQHEKLDRKVQSLQQNPSGLFNVGGKTSHYMPDHGSAIAQTASQAVNYLNSIRPAEQKPSPLDDSIPPTSMQKQKYADALTIAEQPLSILNDVKAGTLSAVDIGHLQAMYPALYQRMQGKLMEQMVTHLSAGETISHATQMGLSLFLQKPMSSTMTPDSMQVIQNVAAPAATQQPLQNQGMQKGPHSMKNIGKLATADQTSGQSRAASKQSIRS